MTKEIGKMLQRAGGLEGVVCVRGEDEIGIKAGHLNDYLLTEYIGQLLERGEMKITVAPSRLDYIIKLIGEKE